MEMGRRAMVMGRGVGDDLFDPYELVHGRARSPFSCRLTC